MRFVVDEKFKLVQTRLLVVEGTTTYYLGTNT